MPYLGEDTKKLGFGLMRLPKLEEGGIDIEQFKVMVDKFLKAGFTYFDTAWCYDGSEEATRKALVERYPRDSYTLATKNSAWLNQKSAEEAKSQLDISLERTGAGYFDYYLLHNLGENRIGYFDDFGMWDWIQEQKKLGRIKHWGFSFHDTPEILREVLENHPRPEFVQLQINYADWDDPEVQSRGVYEVCREYRLPIVIMEPVKGGMLANPPESIAGILKAAEPDSSLPSWAIRFAANLEGVITVLSGMSNIGQMEDNIKTMRGFTHLTQEQMHVIEEAQSELKKFDLIGCTGCGYCARVCPQHVGIPATMSIMNTDILYGHEHAKSRVWWEITMHGGEMPDKCIKCGACEGACPQGLPIRELMERGAGIIC